MFKVLDYKYQTAPRQDSILLRRSSFTTYEKAEQHSTIFALILNPEWPALNRN